jgi:hypothetical protein
MLSPNRDKQHIGVGHFFQLIFMQDVPQIAEMADHQVIHVNNINSVASILLPTFVVVIGCNTGNKDITDFILPRTTYSPWFPPYAHDIVMPWMVVADGDDGGVDLAQAVCVPLRGSLLRRERVGDQGNIFATQLKAGVAQPRYFH